MAGSLTRLPRNRFGVIYADPPWRWEARSAKGEGRAPPYSRMTLDDIKALPIAERAAPDCVLFLWCLDAMLPQALEVIKAWGFTYKTVGFTWAKTTAAGKPHFGLGFWTRCGTEQCLLATRGQPHRRDAGVPQLIMAPRTGHSRKPTDAHKRIERLVPGPYLELFARKRRRGWTVWGDEVK